MDNRLFHDTFCQVRASDDLRLEVLEMTEKSEKQPSRLLPKVLLVAAIIALLTTTAFAASAIFHALKGGDTEFISGGWYAPTGSPYNKGPYDAYEVYIDIEIDPDAPKTIEMCYMPEMRDNYVPYFGAELNGVNQFGWTNGLRNYDDEILFFQFAGGMIDLNDPVACLHIPAGENPKTTLTDLEGISGYLVEDPMFYGRRWFYWTDGQYVFQLAVPDEYSEEQLTEIVKSVHYVPSIEPYLVPEDVYEEIVYGKKD